MKVSDGVTLKEARPPRQHAAARGGPAGPRMSKRDFGATVRGRRRGGATSPDAGLGTLDPLAELPPGSPGEAPPPSPPIVEGGDPLMAKNWGVNPPMQDVDGAAAARRAGEDARLEPRSLPRSAAAPASRTGCAPMLPAIAGHGLDLPYAPPPGAALDDPPSPDPPHLRSGLGDAAARQIVKTATRTLQPAPGGKCAV